MMAQSSYAPLGNNPISVIGSQFCVPNPVELAVVRKVMTFSDCQFVVTDANDNVVFKVKAPLVFFGNRRLLLDAAGNPIVTLRQKMMSAHSRWKAFRGDSKDPSNLLFSTKIPSLFRMKTNLNVYFANNTTEEFCDFKVKGSWSERSCVIYAGDSSTIIAQMRKKITFKSVLIGKDKFLLTVNPNVDYAFIVSLIVILDDINQTRS